MSGCNHGVQERFREEVLQALYIHCHAHRLNLVLVDVVSNVQQAGQFFYLYNFFSNSVAHNVFTKKQRGLKSTAQPVEFKQLSDTLWACRYTALLAIKKSLPAILATLQLLWVDQMHEGKQSCKGTD